MIVCLLATAVAHSRGLDRALLDRTAADLDTYREAINTLSTVAVAGFTGTLWWVTWGLVRLGRDQRADLLRSIRAAESAASAAIQQTTLAEREFAATHRPWVSVEIEPRSNLTALSGGGFSIDLKLIFRNHGNTPALGIFQSLRFVAGSNVDAENIQSTMLKAMELSRAYLPGWGTPLFPGSAQERVAQARREIAVTPGTPTLAPYTPLPGLLIGCVNYAFSFGGLGSTTYCYIITKRGSNGHPVVGAGYNIETLPNMSSGDILAQCDEIVLTPWQFGNNAS